MRIIYIKTATDSYFLSFTDDQEMEAMRQLGRWAGEPTLDFTWLDAGMAYQQIMAGREECVGT